MTPGPYRVLFVCRENSCQSQMAEGWLRSLGGPGVVARSAGTAPRHLHPLATAAMQEAGVDIAAQRGKGIDAVKHERFDVVVTLCDTAAEKLPQLAGAPRKQHTPIDDPTFIEDEHGPDLDEFRRTRDALREVVQALLAAR